MTTAVPAQSQAGSRILVVDDEPRIRDFITRALVTAGYSVEVAGSGSEGLRMATADGYDLVILDLIMPDVAGRQILTALLRERHVVNEVLKAGALVLDVGRLEANIGHGPPIALTRLEFLLLRELIEHAGHSVGKGQLLASVWGYDFDPGSNVVDVCVRRLRSKLGFDLIKTVRGEGYRLAS